MPALSANSEVFGFPIADNSHHAKFSSTPRIRVACNAPVPASLYDANMARKITKSKGLLPEQPNWFLREWMKTLGVKQAALAKDCGWSGSTMHGIYHGRTEYYREIINLISLKLKIEPHELLMHPDRAMAIRRYERSVREEAVKLVHDRDQPKKTGTDGD